MADKEVSNALDSANLMQGLMTQIYDIFTKGGDVANPSEDNFFCWLTPGIPITPEQFEDLSQAASDALCALAGSILDGNAAASPAILKQGIKACEYCPYREACGYDEAVMLEMAADGLITLAPDAITVNTEGRPFVRCVAAALDPLMRHTDKNFSKPI